MEFGRSDALVHVALTPVETRGPGSRRRARGAPEIYRLRAEVVETDGPREQGVSPLYSEEGMGRAMASSLAPFRRLGRLGAIDFLDS